MKKKRFWGVLTGFVLVMGVLLAMSVTAYAETYSGWVSNLQTGDILKPGAKFNANGKIIILEKYGWCNRTTEVDQSFTLGTERKQLENPGTITVGYNSAISNNNVNYYPFADAIFAQAWQVASISDESGVQTITLTGYNDPFSYGIWVGDVAVMNTTTSGTGWSYDVERNTLTLHNYHYTGPGIKKDEYTYAAIYTNKEALTINLEGINSVKNTPVPGHIGYDVGIGGAKNLTIAGNGKLTVEGPVGISTGGNLVINSGSVSVRGTYNDGVESEKLEINGGSVQITSDKEFGVWIGSLVINHGGSAIMSGNHGAILGDVTNAMAGLGWTDMDGTGAGDNIEAGISHSQNIEKYKRMQFPTVLKHEHVWEYSATGDTITAICRGILGTCDITSGLTMTISAPANLTYDGKIKAATLNEGYSTVAFPGEYQIRYYQGEEEIAPENVKNAGDYTAKVTVAATDHDDGVTASVDFTILPAGDLNYISAVVNEKHRVETGTGTVSGYTVVTDSDGSVEWTSGWYVVTDDVTINGDINIRGNDINLILCDGKTLRVNNIDYHQDYNPALTIYGQENGSGVLIASGIDGGVYDRGTITINGGHMKIHPIEGKRGIYGHALTVNRGKLTIERRDSNSPGRGIEVVDTVTLNDGQIIVTGDNTYGIFGKATVYDGLLLASGQQEGIAFLITLGFYVKGYKSDYPITDVSQCQEIKNGAPSSNPNGQYVRIEKIPFIHLEDENVTIILPEGRTAPMVGDTLSVPCNASETDFEWLIGDAVTNVGKTSYTVTKEDVGKTISFRATQRKNDYGEDYSEETAPVKISAATLPVIKKPVNFTLTDDLKPTARTGLKYLTDNDYGTHREVDLLDPPERKYMPEGYDICYSIDNGATWNEGSYVSTISVKDAGTYVVHVKYDGHGEYEDLEGETITVTVGKADPPELIYETERPTAITGLKYSGSPQTIVKEPWHEIPGYALHYSLDEENWSTELPARTDAGDYTVKVRYVGDNNHTSFDIPDLSVSIAMADAPETVTDAQKPTAITGLYYTGSPQALISAPANPPAGYELRYSIDGETWSPEIPTGTLAEEYIVRVRYFGGGNYVDFDGENISVTINEKPLQTITAPDMTVTYGETGWHISATTDGGGAISYAVREGDEDTIDVGALSGALTIKKAGTAVITVTAAKTETYERTTKDVTITIEKATVTIRALDQKETAGEWFNGNVIYAIRDDTYRVVGLMGTDDLTTAPKLKYQKNGQDVTPDYKVEGIYDIVPSNADAGVNYTIRYQKGTLTASRKANQSITAEDMTVTYGDTGKTVIASVTDPAVGGGSISYAVWAGSEKYIEVDETTGALTIKGVPPAGGKAYITVTAAETDVCDRATKDIAVTINGAAPTVTAPTAKTLIGNEQPQELVTAGSTGDGTLYYAVTTENTAPADDSLYSTSIPTAIEAGTYYVWYRVVGDTNHQDTGSLGPIMVIIGEVSEFGQATFIMPTDLTVIGESAFEGMTAMTVVDASHVTVIGPKAFKGCTGLTQIRLPANCAIDETAFDGCGPVYVYAPARGTTEVYCRDEGNPCEFVAEE